RRWAHKRPIAVPKKNVYSLFRGIHRDQIEVSVAAEIGGYQSAGCGVIGHHPQQRIRGTGGKGEGQITVVIEVAGDDTALVSAAIVGDVHWRLEGTIAVA